MDYNSKEWTKIPLEVIKTPSPGDMVYGPSYWIVTPDDHVLRFRESSWQHNKNEQVVKGLIEQLHIGCRAEYVPMSFLPHNCRDYV